ncbi:MAG: MerR family transcriptional regulator [Bacteroidia bacterium]|nr:MerR family transcriptional regulator [Bacteroidia bacterium]
MLGIHNPMPVAYSVKDIEFITGIPGTLLRTWERRYGFPRPRRNKENNFRYYSDSDLLRLLQVQILNRKGYRVSELISMNDEEIRELIEEYFKPNTSLPGREDLYYCLHNLDEEKFHTWVDHSVEKFGFEFTFENSILPFLRYVGDLWFMKIITPVHEHFVSNLVRQKLFRAIDALPKVKSDKQDTVWIFFLNAYELHELALLYYYYLAKKSGKKSLYLGPCVPLEDLAVSASFFGKKILVTTFTSPIRNTTHENYIEMLKEKIKPDKLYFSCAPDLFDVNKFEENYFRNYEDFKKLLF